MNANDNKNYEVNILNHKEYNIKNENDDCNLRIEIDHQYIYFILSKLNEPLEYIYKNKLDLTTIINKLELNASKYTNLELILTIIDNLNKKNRILIKINEDNSCNLLFKLTNAFDGEFINEIKLYKEHMNNNDKFNILFSKIKNINIKEEGNKEIEDIKNKINELNINMNKNDEEIRDIINQKDIIIKNMNEKLINQENMIKEIEKKLLNNFMEKFNEIKKDLI